jgi:ribosomal protein S18 acetylase RimI-like enzyme
MPGGNWGCVRFRPSSYPNRLNPEHSHIGHIAKLFLAFEMYTAMTELHIFRAGEQDREAAFQIVEEYNNAVSVMLRDSPESFAKDYFQSGAGLWLAQSGTQLVGCIALRPLHTHQQAGEIKRLYVRPEFRASGAALALLVALERYAKAIGYRWLYLDSKDDLQAALRFYRRQGYQACEPYNQNPQATVFMRKALDSEVGLQQSTG